MWPIQTQDKLFHDGNGTTELGTVVTAEWLNDVQQALLMVLAAGGQTPAKGNHNLLRDAIQRIVNNHTPAASVTGHGRPGDAVLARSHRTRRCAADAGGPTDVFSGRSCDPPQPVPAPASRG